MGPRTDAGYNYREQTVGVRRSSDDISLLNALGLKRSWITVRNVKVKRSDKLLFLLLLLS